MILRVYPNSLQDWFRLSYPHIDPSIVHFANAAFSQDALNPWTSQIIVPYRLKDDRIHVHGFLNYGDDHLTALSGLQHWVPPSKPAFIVLPNTMDEFIDMDSIKRRIDWILNPKFTKRPLDAAFHVLMCIGPYVSGFYKLQMVREKANFDVLSLCEDDIAHFLHNQSDLGMELVQLLGPPTPLDLQRVWRQWRPAQEPTIWLQVPMEDFPMLHGHELYPGGLYHMTLFDIAEHWVWKRWTHRFDKRSKREHPEQMDHLIGYIRKKMEELGGGGEEGEFRESVPTQRLAPCIGAILSADRFPQDRERQQLVRVLASAKVSLSYVEKTLGDLNEQYPHADGKRSLKARWDYEAHYNVGYAPPLCEAMETCPYVGRLDQKKAACAKYFIERFGKPPKQLKGPRNWFDDW